MINILDQIDSKDIHSRKFMHELVYIIIIITLIIYIKQWPLTDGIIQEEKKKYVTNTLFSFDVTGNIEK